MTTKVSQFRPPIGTHQPGVNRIIIDYNPATGLSNLHTEGMLTIPAVLSVLLAQVNSLWANFLKISASSIVGANGQPVLAPETPPPPVKPEGDPQ